MNNHEEENQKHLKRSCKTIRNCSTRFYPSPDARAFEYRVLGCSCPNLGHVLPKQKSVRALAIPPTQEFCSLPSSFAPLLLLLQSPFPALVNLRRTSNRTIGLHLQQSPTWRPIINSTISYLNVLSFSLIVLCPILHIQHIRFCQHIGRIFATLIFTNFNYPSSNKDHMKWYLKLLYA